MDIITLSKQAEERYRRYLQTTFYFRDPILRESFKEALSSGHLSRGPFLEGTPVFKQGPTPLFLIQNLLGFQPDDGFLKALQQDRPLYTHQERAISAVHNRNNIVVATGTGSGKTEAFLYPILLKIYQEFQQGTLSPGVRALILYPMNALANDQRERIGAICKCLIDTGSPFRFTFGQYIGDTPEDENDSQRHARDHMANRLPGEMVLRSEMRNTPPNILLTNYSMLEYLLLRPDDSPLFDNGQARWWTFLVLDEAHQYRGSRGIEMAMLLRRLKQRLIDGGLSEQLSCIATSASLIQGDEGKPIVAKFASELFGEEFKGDNVILGEQVFIPELNSIKLSLDEYEILTDALEREEEKGRKIIQELALKLGVTVSINEDLARMVGELLRHDSRATNLRQIVTGKPMPVQELAEKIFSDISQEKRLFAVSQLVGLLTQASDPISKTPLLSARYHLFLRSLEGAFLSYSPLQKVFLERHTQGSESAAFEIALCRECGQHYLVGKITKEKLVEAIRDPSHQDFGATFFMHIDGEKCEHENELGDDKKELYRLCVRCSEIRRFKEHLRCGHNEQIIIAKQEEMEEREDQVPRCSACGYQAPDPVREVVHGTDGPHAVIVTTLYQFLPEESKKLLAFADGRQEAAFFAWYLEKSYRDILIRNLILKAAQEICSYTENGLSLRELAAELNKHFINRKVFPSSLGELEIRRMAWLTLYKEFMSDEPRISLEGLGLVQWKILWPSWFTLPEILKSPPWSLSDNEASNLVFSLLDLMRADKAVEILPEQGISIAWSDIGIQSPQMRVRIGQPRGIKNVRSWDGKTGRRAHLLVKLLSKDGELSEEDILNKSIDTLRAIWEHLKKCDENAPSSSERLLLTTEDARRLNPNWWRLQYLGKDSEIFKCDVCGRLESISVRGICSRHRCQGTLKISHAQNLEPNHYRLLYEAELPGNLRVEEHTAQLDKEKAREFQREFRNGKINVLSCSTTFELGVDLGDLDTIFLRNVPPESFNYAQRVGRAGRRRGRTGFAITYCRRGPHDLYHFNEPAYMLSGRIHPPVLTISNEKIISRHIVAIVLSAFFRAFPEKFGNVESFFKDLASPSGVIDFNVFLREYNTELEKSLVDIVPPGMITEDRGWVAQITGDDSRLSLAELEVSSDYRNVLELEQKYSQMKTQQGYILARWANARAKTITKEDILSFLSRKAVIPKYGFPVDIVELDTHKTQQNHEAFEVLLQRDLSIAISEFAPTAKVVANKKVWASYGLKKVAEKEWPIKFYKRCSRHNTFYKWDPGKPEPPTQCGDKLTKLKYVIPQFGFVSDRTEPKDPTSRTVRVFTTRPYFAGSAEEPGTLTFPSDSNLITLRKASPGLMSVVSEGRRGEGFYICSGCGAGFRKRENSHKTPYGQDCRVALEQFSLGHEFITDVIQIRFHLELPYQIDPVWFAHSLAYAIVEGAAECLEVPSTDLNATVGYHEDALPPIILYDNVPGGAGLVARLETEKTLLDCLTSAFKRVNGGCGCDNSTSCYGCLRSYRNQFAHQKLQRGPVKSYLEAILSRWNDSFVL